MASRSRRGQRARDGAGARERRRRPSERRQREASARPDVANGVESRRKRSELACPRPVETHARVLAERPVTARVDRRRDLDRLADHRETRRHVPERQRLRVRADHPPAVLPVDLLGAARIRPRSSQREDPGSRQVLPTPALLSSNREQLRGPEADPHFRLQARFLDGRRATRRPAGRCLRPDRRRPETGYERCRVRATKNRILQPELLALLDRRHCHGRRRGDRYGDRADTHLSDCSDEKRDAPPAPLTFRAGHGRDYTRFLPRRMPCRDRPLPRPAPYRPNRCGVRGEPRA